jgi:hypothetical protein
VIHANNEGELVTRLQPIPQILDSKEVL